MRVLQKVASITAVLFGVVTILAGGRVLLGFDPGYVVFRPLLVYNTAMGAAYVAAGAVIWRDPGRGRGPAGAIALLNFAVLIAIFLERRTGGGVAVDSLRAMTFRTVVWVALFLVVSWPRWSGETATTAGPEGRNP